MLSDLEIQREVKKEFHREEILKKLLKRRSSRMKKQGQGERHVRRRNLERE